LFSKEVIIRKFIGVFRSSTGVFRASAERFVMARFMLLRANIDPASLTMHVKWATLGADRVLIEEAQFGRRGSVRIPVRIGARLTLTAIGPSGVEGEARFIYLTPTFDGWLPLTSRPVRPWRDYLALRSAGRTRATTEFRRMLIDLRMPRMRFGPSRPVRRSRLQSARLADLVRRIGALPGRQRYLPIANSRAELRKREDRCG
jgi:hypothetical protein